MKFNAMRMFVIVLCLPWMALLSAGCLAASNYRQLPVPTATAADRTDCGAILGTAFRSEAEETWFTTRCSTWAPQTLGRVAGPSDASTIAITPAGAGADQVAATAEAAQGSPNTGRCEQLRSQQFPSSEDRLWALANCVATPAAGTQGSDAPGPEACDQLGGTTGLSAQELAWVRANCNQTPR